MSQAFNKCVEMFHNLGKNLIKLLQEDFNDMDGVPVTSQPAPGQGTSNSNIPIAMPAPNPTNPFASAATEQTSLNTSEQATYTPGN